MRLPFFWFKSSPFFGPTLLLNLSRRLIREISCLKILLDILQSCSGNASHWVKDVEFESVIAVWASVFALKITIAQLVVLCIYATTAVFGNEWPAFTYLLNSHEMIK